MMHAGLLGTGHVPDSTKPKIQTQYLVGWKKKKKSEKKKDKQGHGTDC